jgi:glucokinase
VESALAEVCYHITNLTIALDPERVVMGGGLMRAADYILPRVADHIDRFVPFPPAVVPAGLSLDSPLLGAVALAIEPDLVS